MKKFLFILAIILIGNILIGQEVIIPLTSHLQYIRKTKEKSTKNDTLSLPFFDDFSSGEINPQLWENHGVTINTTSSVLPPSYGVAQFDATDSSGNFYSTYETPAISDKLISKPINLNYSSNQNIFLSFFYQAGGLQDMPDGKDTLLLQFFSPSDSSWTTVWYAIADENMKNTFHQVIIPITQTKYLQKGFRFRFMNYTSLGTASYPSLVSNCDFWYIDYIYLDRNRYNGDTTYRDVALQYPAEIKFDNYSCIPFSHYKENYNTLKHNILVRFRNNDGVSRTIDSLYIVFRDKNTADIIDTLYLGSYSFPPYGNFFVQKNDINYHFPLNYSSLDMTANLKLITDNYDPTDNNTVKSTVALTDFYAYDDATPEAGYGLYGDGTFHAMVAAKFHTLKADRLLGVKIYFNKTYQNRQPHYFYLMIWKSDPQTGLPGELIYQKAGEEVDFDKLNSYQTYLIDTPITVRDTFFIGWKKTDEQLMNVGLDLNNPTDNYKYFNITGTWQPSSITGNLMIRPIFGQSYVSGIHQLENQIKVYPNPATEFFTIKVEKPSTVEIYSLAGHKIAFYQVYSQKQIPCSEYRPGVYILRIISGSHSITRKIIIK